MLQQRARSQWLSKGKNCAMLNARELVNMFLIYPIQIKWVSVIPASVVNLNLRPPSWLWWIKLLEMIWNWSLSPITFLINFPNVFRSIMGLKDFSELYNVLLGFEITIVIEFLKWLGQYSISKHALAIAMMFFKHILSLNDTFEVSSQKSVRSRCWCVIVLDYSTSEFFLRKWYPWWWRIWI